jgi:hypothetical protein
MILTPRQEMAKYITQAQQSRYFIDKVGFISTKSYLAVGDGVTDDHTAIQNAINAASTAGNRMIWFPHGTYKNVGALTNDSSVRFIGDNASITDSTYPVLDFSQMLTDNSSTILGIQSTLASFSTSIGALYDYASTFASQISQLQADTTSLRSDFSSHINDASIHFTVANCTNADMLSYSTTVGGWSKIARGTAGQVLGMSSNADSQVWYDSMQSLITAPGDTITGSTDSVPIKLAMGTADKSLKVTPAGDKLGYDNVSKSGTFSDTTTSIDGNGDFNLTIALGCTPVTCNVIVYVSDQAHLGSHLVVSSNAAATLCIYTEVTTQKAVIGHAGLLSDAIFASGTDIHLTQAYISGTNLILSFHNDNGVAKTLKAAGSYTVTC